MNPSEERFIAYASSKARLRDRLYFVSDERAARDNGVTRRTVQRWKRTLEGRGILVRVDHPCPHFRTVCYRVVSANVTQRTSCQKPSAQRSSCKQFSGCNRSGTSLARRAAMKERERDLVWDALTEHFGPVRTKDERSRRNAACKQLREAEATADEIRIAYEYCANKFSHFTEMALCSWLSRALHEHGKGDARETFLRLLERKT